jgi:HAE1 family hydrophobic/amphiphilic exporter-1
MVFGLVSFKKIGVDLIPNVEFPFVVITVTYPGTDPETMERDVGDKIEEAVNSLGGIRSLKAYNLESVTQVLIEFELEVKSDLAVQDVREKVRQAPIRPSSKSSILTPRRSWPWHFPVICRFAS